MKKLITFMALIAIAICAKAHNVIPVSSVKMPGALTAVVTVKKDTTVVPISDSLWYRVLIYADSNLTGTPISGPWDSGTVYMFTKTVPIPDTICCAMVIETKHRDTITHALVSDVSHFVIMSKPPTGSVTYTVSTDSIYYNLNVKGGNNNGVPVLIEAFTDTTCMWAFGSSTMYYVSGPSNFNFTGAVRAHFYSGMSYCIRITVTNPVTGVKVLKQIVTTATPFTTLPYVELSSPTTATDTSVNIFIGLNCFSRKSLDTLYLRDSTEVTWSRVIPISNLFDTTITGLQTQTVHVGGLHPSHTYLYDVKVKNIVGPTLLGTQRIQTLDTPVFTGSTNTFALLSVNATYNAMADSIIYNVYVGNVVGGTSTINAVLDKAGSVIYSIMPVTKSGHGIVRVAFPVSGDTGNFQVYAWSYDDLGSTDSTGSYVAYTSHVPVHVPGKNTTGILDVTENKNLHGCVNFYSEIGEVVGKYKCTFGEINMIAPNNKFIIYEFISDDGQFTNRQKIFVQR
ncbi:MAG: hypothetical protein WCO65_00805 [bacterium]